MKRIKVQATERFNVIANTESAQAAVMVLAPGTSTGGPANRHRGSDQWLQVLSGRGEATVEGEALSLEPGVLLLIEAGETHEIASKGEAPLTTLNIYVPPAY